MTNDTEILTREPASAASLAPRPDVTGEMSVRAIVARKAKMQEVMQSVMREGPNGHYGLIPGCGDKPALFKSGAEVLSMVFGLAPRFIVTLSDLSSGHREYRVSCAMTHIASGAFCGEGVGSCSTMESKYRWRGGERKCPKCGKAAIIKGKEEYGGGWLCFAKKGGCGAKWSAGAKEIEAQSVGRTENPDIADTYNTVLKMAKKRALVDATLTVTGASDLFTQDIEELALREEEYAVVDEARRVATEPKPAPAAKPSAPAAAPAAGMGSPAERKAVLDAIKAYPAERIKAAAATVGLAGKVQRDTPLADLKRLRGELDAPPADEGYDPIMDGPEHGDGDGDGR